MFHASLLTPETNGKFLKPVDEAIKRDIKRSSDCHFTSF